MDYPKETEIALVQASGLTQPCLHVNSASVPGILDRVKNIVLNWAIKLEQDGILGEGLSFSVKEKEAAASTSYHITNFYGPVGQSQIQQSSLNPVQVSIQNDLDLERVRAFIVSLEKSIGELKLHAATEKELAAQVKTVEAQLESPNPKTSIITDALETVQVILENAGGTLAAQLVTQLVQALG